MTRTHHLLALATLTLTMWLAACGQSADEASGEPGANGRIRTGALEKGAEGAVNGASDYCRGDIACAAGEGNCRSDAECEPGLTCVPDNGERFGLNTSTNVCVPAGCARAVVDDAPGATGCGATESPYTPGSSKYCSASFLCQAGEGNCSNDAECVGDLTCVHDNGERFGFNASTNVCVPTGCAQAAINDADGATGCGALESPYTPGSSKYCSASFLCEAGEGNCSNDAECVGDLVCIHDNGERFGYAASTNVCVPQGCARAALEDDPLAVDCGADETTYTLGSSKYCSPSFLCESGQGNCSNDAECLGDLVCVHDNGERFGFAASTNVCVPAGCAQAVIEDDPAAMDCGADESPYTPGSSKYCSPSFLCEAGQGNCSNDAECVGDLACVRDNGERFGLSPSVNVCVPAGCAQAATDDAPGAAGCGADMSPYAPGSSKYCSPSFPCGASEGNCSNDDECVGDLVCVRDNGERFGFAASTNVCVPAGCAQAVDDDVLGATGCGATESPHPPGSSKYCSQSFLCQAGEGNCSNTEECAGDLVCVRDNGERFGLSPSVNVCVPSGCAQASLDDADGATGCGALESPYPPGSSKYCSASFLCQAGEGNCSNDAECVGELACVRDNGERFGLSPSVNVCVPAGCGASPGGDFPGATGCGEDESANPPGDSNHCSSSFPCTAGEGNCSSDGECLGELVCVRDNGDRFGFAASVNVCAPAGCSGDPATDAGGVTGCESTPAPAGPTIAPLASPVVAPLGSQATLSAGVVDALEPYAWRWWRGSAPVGEGASIVIPQVTAQDAGAYTVRVTGLYSGLTDTASLSLVVEQPAQIVSVTGATVAAGQSATLTVDALGDGLSYEWTRGGQVVGTSAALSLSGVTPADAGVYSVRVSNAQNLAGDTGSAELVVVEPPVIDTSPAGVTVTEGQGFTLGVGASGGGLTAQWARDGSDVPGATGLTYSVPASTLADAGTYTVTVTNLAGSATSDPATVTVEPATAFAITRQPADATVAPGDTARFTVEATGDALTYQWLRDGQPLQGATSPEYSFTASSTDDGARFGARVSRAGQALTSQDALLTVRGLAPPQLTLDPEPPAQAFTATITLEGTVTDDATPAGELVVAVTSDRIPMVELTTFAGDDGRFALDVPLAPGDNALEVTARDGDGPEGAPLARAITRALPARPEVTITAPTPGFATAQDTVQVTGEVATTLPPEDVRVLLGGTQASLLPGAPDGAPSDPPARYWVTASGVLAYAFDAHALTPGANLIEVQAESPAGNSTAQVGVTRVASTGGQGAVTLDLGTGPGRAYTRRTPYTLTGVATGTGCVQGFSELSTTPAGTNTTTQGLGTPVATLSTSLELLEGDNAVTVRAVGIGCDAPVEQTRALTVTLDSAGPVISLDGIASGSSLSVTGDPLTITGTITEANLAGATLAGQPLELTPSGTPGEYALAADLSLDPGTRHDVDIEVWDLAGNRATYAFDVTLDIDRSLSVTAPAPGEVALVDASPGEVTLRALARGAGSGDAVEYALDAAASQWEPMAATGGGRYEATLTLASGEYTVALRMRSGAGEELAAASVSFEVADLASVPLELVGSSPGVDAVNVETNAPFSFTLNRKPADMNLLEVRVLETADSWVWQGPDNGADLRTLSKVERTRVSHERLALAGALQPLPGGRAYAFYPVREWTYDATLFVEVLYDGASLGRRRFDVRAAPTLAHGFVRDPDGNPVPDATVRLSGYSTRTDGDGGFSFGWGWPADRQLPAGAGLLEVNMGAGLPGFTGHAARVPVHAGEINALGTFVIAPVNPTNPTTYLSGDAVTSTTASVDSGRLSLTFAPGATLSFPDGGREAGLTRAQFIDLEDSGYGASFQTPTGFGWALTPSGIELTGAVEVSIQVPRVQGSHDYIEGLRPVLESDPEGTARQPVLWAVALDPGTLTLRPVGLMTIDPVTHIATTHEPITPRRLDIVGAAVVTPGQFEAVNAYLAGDITWLEVLAGL